MLIILIVIIITIILVVLFRRKGENTGDIETKQSLEQTFQEVNKLKKIESKNEWINVQNCLNRYCDYSDEFRIMEEIKNNSESIPLEQEVYNERVRRQLIDIIPEFVKDKLKITQENIYETIGIKNEVMRVSNIYQSVQTVSSIPYEETTSIYAYIVDGVLIKKEDYSKRNFKLVVLIDNINNTFAIIPNEYIELEKVNVLENNNIQLYDEEQIEKNEFNVFSLKTASNEEICQWYFANYKSYLIYDTEFAYDCLDQEYREERFGDFKNFEKFVQQNLEEINKAELKKYLVNNYNNYTEYICQDQYQNLYIFNEEAILDFTLKLDTYTIPTEKFITTYQSSDEQNKVMMNIDKWIQMLNNRDYTAAYNLLDETYRNNTFGSEEQFETIMREKLPSHYKAEYSGFSKENKTYIQPITLKDIMGESEDSIQISVIMQLKEELDFVMSFSFD